MHWSRAKYAIKAETEKPHCMVGLGIHDVDVNYSALLIRDFLWDMFQGPVFL